MPDKPAALLSVQVLRMSPSDVARGVDDLLGFEQAASAAWSQEDRSHVKTVVRAVLLRLLSTDSWMPGSVQVSPGRLDIRLTVEFGGDAEILLALAREQLEAEVVRARARLVELVKEMEIDGA